MNSEKKSELIFHVRDTFVRETIDPETLKVISRKESIPICTIMVKKINDNMLGMTYSVPNIEKGDRFCKKTGVDKVTNRMQQIDHYTPLLDEVEILPAIALKDVLPTKVLRNMDILKRASEYFGMDKFKLLTATDSNFGNSVALINQL